MLRHVRLGTATAALAVVAVVLAVPASAAPALTRSQVTGALLTATDLGPGWHSFTASSPGADVQGCRSSQFTTVGLRFAASHTYRFHKAATFVDEGVQSFKTLTGAKTDFRKSVRLFSACATFTVNGKTWKITRLTPPAYADQQALFRITGAVASAKGDLPVTVVLAASRWGRQEVQVSTIVGGSTTAADRRALRVTTVKLGKQATAKVASHLGR